MKFEEEMKRWKEQKQEIDRKWQKKFWFQKCFKKKKVIEQPVMEDDKKQGMDGNALD